MVFNDITHKEAQSQLMENMEMPLLDISGITTIDSVVAAHLIKITKATKLMGCNAILSGVSPAIAQTIVNLGIDIDHIETTVNLNCQKQIKYNVEYIFYI